MKFNAYGDPVFRGERGFSYADPIDTPDERFLDELRVQDMDAAERYRREWEERQAQETANASLGNTQRGGSGVDGSGS